MGRFIRVLDGLTDEHERSAFLQKLIPRDPARAAEIAALQAKDAVAEIERRRLRYRAENGLSEHMRQMTLDNFEIRSDLQLAGRKIATAFLGCLTDLKLKRGPMIWGPTGCGKSHLIRAMVNMASEIEMPQPAYYLNCFTVENISKDRWAEILEVFQRVRLFALDDIDKALYGDAAPWARDRIKSLLDMADANGHPILIGSTQFPRLTVAATERSLEIPGHDRLQKEEIMSRFTLFLWRQMDGPDGRSDEFIDDSEVQYWAR